MKKLNCQALTQRLKNMYPNENLEVIEYTLIKEPVKVRCNTCNTIYTLQTADQLNKQKERFCQKCADSKAWIEKKQEFKKWLFSSNFELISDLNEIHDSQQHIITKCKKCGLIQNNKRIYDYLAGKQCYCITKSTHKPKEIQEQEIKNHYKLFDEYTNVEAKVKVQNLNCGHIFTSRYADLLRYNNMCPICKKSHGESLIESWLNQNDINYISQYKIIIDAQRYYVDFYIPDYNLFIEYNGIQHYKAVTHFGGETKFIKQQKRDNLIHDYIINELNKKLLIISYKDDKQINDILKENIIC